MSTKKTISINLPNLSPEAAYALLGWMERLAFEIESYYSDEVRSFLDRQDREAAELDDIDNQIEQIRGQESNSF